jgi:hypothetical protein
MAWFMEHRRDVPGGDIWACTACGSCRGPESASGSQGFWSVAGDGTEDAAVRGAASELIEARDDKKLLRFQRQIASYELLIVDELGFVPLSKTGAELLFEMLSQRYERGSTMVTSNLPFQEWTEVLGSERLTGALLDRLTHHVYILEMNADSYRLKQSRRKRTSSAER